MLNLKSIKVTNGENIDNLPIQVSTKGIWGVQGWFTKLEGSTSYSLGNLRILFDGGF